MTMTNDKAFDTCKKIVQLEEDIRSKMFESISLYEEVFKNEYYKSYVGEEGASWNVFLGLPEVTRSRTQLNSWFMIKKKLIDEFGISFDDLYTIKISKADLIAKYAKTKEEAVELVSKAKTLLPSEWRDVSNSLRGKPVSDDGHVHDWKKYKQCKICGCKELAE